MNTALKYIVAGLIIENGNLQTNGKEKQTKAYNHALNEENYEANKEIKIGMIRGIWMMLYGSSRSKNEMETIALILLLLEKDPPSTNPYWTLTDLKNNIKKTYADIQKAVWYLEENKVIETGKNWMKNQGNRRYIKVTFKGKDFLGSCKLLANKTLKELNKKRIKKTAEEVKRNE